MSLDTIYALSSGALPAGIAVVRLSGPEAFAATKHLIGHVPSIGRAALRTLRRQDHSVLDQALVVAFEAPASFTGEDTVEFHLHGSRAVVSALFAEFRAIPGLRPAEAGEYARRAFDNGKIDLVEVEGLADLIDSETEMQRRLAIEQGFGGLSDLYMGWAGRLTRSRALIEAELDFADEDDVPGSVADQVWADVAKIHADLTAHVSGSSSAEIIRDGFKIVIAGPPNAGKSSLMNALAKRDVAIVTEIAGTTRDILHVDLDLEGYLVRLYDTAGMRDSDDRVEQEGIRRAQLAVEQADLVLILEEIDSETKPASRADRTIAVGTKLDVHSRSTAYDVCISASSGEGLEHLRDLILDRVRAAWTGSLVPSRDRHLRYLTQASHFLAEALEDRPLDLRAESLRAAAASLGRITGRVDVEQLLDVIFSQFCIGK